MIEPAVVTSVPLGEGVPVRRVLLLEVKDGLLFPTEAEVVALEKQLQSVLGEETRVVVLGGYKVTVVDLPPGTGG